MPIIAGEFGCAFEGAVKNKYNSTKTVGVEILKKAATTSGSAPKPMANRTSKRPADKDTES